MGANSVTQYGKYANFQDLSGSSLPDGANTGGALYYSNDSFHLNTALTANALTASYAKIGVLDVNEINSNTVNKTEQVLEVVDKLIIAGSGSASAAVDGGGLQIGGTNAGSDVAGIFWDHSNTALDFNIGTTTEMRLQNGALLPQANNDIDLGSDALEFKDLWIDGVAYIDDIHAADCDIDGGAIDGTVIGAASAAAGSFTSLDASGDLTVATITCSGFVVDADGDTNLKSLRVDDNSYIGSDSVTDLIQLQSDGDIIIKDGAYDFDIASHDGTNGLLLGGVTVTATAAELNYVDIATLGTAAASKALTIKGDSTWTVAGMTCANLGTVTTMDLDGGSIDGTTIGAASAAAGTFAALTGSTIRVTGMTNGGQLWFSDTTGRVSGSQALAWNGSNALVVTGYVSASAGLRTGGTLNVDGAAMFDSTLSVTGAVTLKSTCTVSGQTNLDGDVNLGNATGDTITATGRFDSDLVPSSDSARDLGTSALQWSEAHIDTGYIDTVTATNVDGILGANTAAAATVTTLDTSAAVNLNLTTDATNSTSGALIVDGGVGIAKKLYVGTDLDVDGTTNLDAVDIDGAVQIDNTITVGVNDTGYDVKFWGDTASRYFLWDTSTNGVGIGKACVSGYAIDVATGHGNVRADSFVTYSDRTLKTNIQKMNGALEKVMKLEAVTYDKKATGKSEIGFIAQDVAKVVPEVCALDANGEGRGIDYSRMSTLLVGALKAQQDQIAQLKAVVAKLQK